jgi:hypothetical protein
VRENLQQTGHRMQEDWNSLTRTINRDLRRADTRARDGLSGAVHGVENAVGNARQPERKKAQPHDSAKDRDSEK